MRFRSGAKLDPGEISDRRGSGMRRGPGMALGGGGGVVGLIVAVLFALSAMGGGGGSSTNLADQSNGDLAQTCRTGADANQREDCRIVAVVNSVQEYWTGALRGYRRAQTVFFTEQTQTE